MDSTELRIILLILGIAFVAGIYFWDKRKHVDSRFFKRQSVRKKPRHDHSVFDAAEEEVEAEITEVPDKISLKVETDAQTQTVADQPQKTFSFSTEEKMANDEDLSFSSRSAFEEFEAGADLPTKIIQVNLIARNSEISGQMILDLASEFDMQLGEFNIFHRMDRKTGKSIFSMANIVEPGTFDPDNMQHFKTPGLTLFSQLPAPVDCLTVYSEMMNVAKRISYIVGAEMQDQSHSVMTSQSIEHERDRIVEYKQQLNRAMQSL